MEQVQPFRDERGLRAPCSFLPWPLQDLILTAVSSNTFMTLWCLSEEHTVWFTWGHVPPANPGLEEGPGAWAHSLGGLQDTPRLFVGGRGWGRTILTVANGKAGECDQKPGLQFTGKMILPEKEILFKEPKNKDIWGLLWEIRMSHRNCWFSLYNRILYSWRDLFIWFFALSGSSLQCTQAAVQKIETVQER